MSEEIRKYLFAFSVIPVFGSFIALAIFTKLDWDKALIYGVFCQIGVFGLAFGKKVWDKIEPVIVDWLANSTIATANKLVMSPVFKRRYYEDILKKYDVFNVKGLVNNFDFVKFEHIFVELSLDNNPRNGSQVPNIVTLIGVKNNTEQLKGNHPIWDFIREAKTREYNGIAWAIIGAPGSGKTSLLQNIAITLAANKESLHKIPDYIPITLSLREQVNKIEQGIPLYQLLQEYFGDNQRFFDLKPPLKWFEDKLENGKCLILLDGLDEVADINKRKIVSKWIDTQISNYNKSRFIITGRPQGYYSAPLQRAKTLRIRPFSNAQVQKFVTNWYLIHEKEENVAKVKADNLIGILQNTPTLKDICVNPLLLTMIVIVHDFRGALPGSRDELYKELCKSLLEDWQQEKEIEEQWNKEQKFAVLCPLAHYLMENSTKDISFSDLQNVIKEPLSLIGVPYEETEKFLDELELRSGLLIEIENETWGFVHLSFQEYLTAQYWLRNKDIKPDWVKLVDNSWWYESLRFYAAQASATPIIEACEKSGKAQSIALLNAIKLDDFTAQKSKITMIT